jgi:hypothetical protein
MQWNPQLRTKSDVTKHQHTVVFWINRQFASVLEDMNHIGFGEPFGSSMTGGMAFHGITSMPKKFLKVYEAGWSHGYSSCDFTFSSIFKKKPLALKNKHQGVVCEIE